MAKVNKSDKTKYYLGNPNLPAADAQIAYEPWMVKEIKKSRMNLLHFAENYFHIIDPDKGKKTTISLFPYQKRLLRTLRDSRKAILISSRQSGKTTCLTIFSLWVAVFNEYQNVVIVANKEATAIEVFRRVKLAYENLPEWLKPGVVAFATTSCEFDNGSRISISTTTGSAARGMSITCVDGDTLISLKHIKSSREETMRIADLVVLLSEYDTNAEIAPGTIDIYQHKTYKNDDFEILTDQEYKNFKGVIVGTNPNKIIIKFSTGMLICTPEHKLKNTNLCDVYAKDLCVGDVVHGDIIVQAIEHIENDNKVYEILDVEGIHRYYSNGILSSQCLILDELAWVEPPSLLEDFWRSVFPTISRSRTSKVLVASTPNGTGNLFHKLYEGAVKGDNGFAYEKVMWDEVPGRDQEWMDAEIKALGSMEAFRQEYCCVHKNTLVGINIGDEFRTTTIQELYSLV